MSVFDVRLFLMQISKPNLVQIVEELSSFVQNEKGDLSSGSLTEAELREYIFTVLTSPDKVGEIIKGLTPYERAVLDHFIYYTGQDLLTYRQIEQKVNGIKPHLFRIGLTGLRRKGMIYTIRRQWGEVAYVFPRNVEEAIYSSLTGEEMKVDFCLEEVQKTSAEKTTILEDIYWLLDEFRTYPKHEISLTQKGMIQKKYIRAWKEKWPDRDPFLENCSLAFDHRETYTPQVVLVLDFLTHVGLLHWFEGSIQLELKKAEEWMKKSRKEMMIAFLEYWLLVYVPSSPWLTRYLKDMYALLGGQASHTNLEQKKTWIYLLALVENWEGNYTLPAIKQVQMNLMEEVLVPLDGLGFIECGLSATKENVWRWHEQEECADEIWLQPTLEVFCPRVVPYSFLWQLTRYLSFQSWEPMLILSISPAKVQGTMSGGELLREWLKWLESKSPNPIPHSFEEQLLQLQNKQERILISDMTVIEIEDNDLAKAFLQWPEIQKLSVKQIQDTLFLLPLSDKEKVTEFVKKRGIHLTQSALEKEESKRGKDVYLIKKRNLSKVMTNVENVIPDLMDAFPSWQRLPEMWKKQFHGYHDKTKREIVEQAIHHHFMLKIEDTAGRIHIIVPERCELDAGHWVCYARDHRKYVLTQMNRMQLLLPEI